MRIIWTKSTMPLSLVIRYGLHEPVSHIAMVFDERMVFHSNLLGCHVQSYKSFAESCTIMYSMDFPMSEEAENHIFYDMFDKFDGKGYDYGAFTYFAWRAFLLNWFKAPMPAKNPWGRKDSDICTELVGSLPKSVLPLDDGRDFGMVSPYQFLLMLCQVRGLPVPVLA